MAKTVHSVHSPFPPGTMDEPLATSEGQFFAFQTAEFLFQQLFNQREVTLGLRTQAILAQA